MEVTREIVLDAPLDDVWEALTDADELAEWFANDVELELRPGGRGRFHWNDGEERNARPGDRPERRLAFRGTTTAASRRARRGRRNSGHRHRDRRAPAGAPRSGLRALAAA